MKEERIVADDTAQKAEEVISVEKAEDKDLAWNPPFDPKLASYIEDCKLNISTLQSKEEQIEALAR